MKYGEISGNSNSGVFVYGSFTMEGGEISGNKAGSAAMAAGATAGVGGGVSVWETGSFSKTGGIIYGDTDNNPDNGNAKDNTATRGNTWGHAVYYYGPEEYHYYRDATLDPVPWGNISTSTLPETATGSYDSTNWIKKQ